MINAKFAVTMLLCTQTWGLHCDSLFCTEPFWGLVYLLLTRRRRTPARLVPVHIYIWVEVFKRSSLLYSCSGTFTASTVNAVGGPFNFRSKAVRRGCPFVVYLSLFLAVWSCRVVWLVCVGRRTSYESCAFRNLNNFHMFTCLYNNNTLGDSEIHQFINFEFQNDRLRLETSNMTEVEPLALPRKLSRKTNSLHYGVYRTTTTIKK